VPYWKKAPVATPLGLTVPFNVAELEVGFVAEPVVAVGVGHEATFIFTDFETGLCPGLLSVTLTVMV
jgi:hypothetical protein